MPEYETVAGEFIAAIQKLAENPDRLNNFASYLFYHFPAWLEKYASTPEGITEEFTTFANMEV